MNPNNSSSSLAYDAKTAQSNLRSALDFAKKNPEHPDAVELRRRMERGMFNFELKSMGLPEVPVNRPPVDLSRAIANVQMQPAAEVSSMIPEPEKQKGFMGFDVDLSMKGLKERFGDVKDTFIGVGEAGNERIDKAREILKDGDFNVAQKLMGVLGQVAGGAADTVGEVNMGLGKLALTQDAEDKLAGIVGDAAEKLSETETVQSIASWYNGLDKDNKLIVDSAGGIASLMAEVVGLKGVGKVVSKAANVTEKAASATAKVAKEGVKAVGESVDAFRAARQPARIAAQEAKVDDAVGRILQGAPEDVPAAKRALSQVDTTDVRTYADLNGKLNARLEAVRKKLDTELDTKYPDRIPADKLMQKTTVGDQIVTTNPVKDGLDEMITFFQKTNNAPEAARYLQLKNKFETEGLTLKEINQISRDHGKNLNAFNASGELASGLSKQAAENTRKGLKQVVRDRLPDDVKLPDGTNTNISKELDSQMSDLLDTLKLTEQAEVKVSKLENRIKNRTLAQKVGGAAADVADLATFGTLRGFVGKLIPSNMGNKTMNYLDIQKELQKNLKEIDKLLEIKDEKKFAAQLDEYLNSVQPGLSTRATASLTEPEKDVLLGRLQSITSNDVKFADGQIDLETFDRLEELKKAAERPRGLTEREYAELQFLLVDVLGS